MSHVIEIDNLSKAYRLGIIGGRTLRGDLARWTARLRGLPDPALKIGQEHLQRLETPGGTSRGAEVFWALRNLNLEVHEGEILGIIGRNGAGKSTLLKILSRVTGPTEGEVRIRGRIASLLEVGTGFHPELTGRENVFLNGAILGMTKAEVRRKFDEIVDFSECGEFIDTPVKRYSSGMYVRLAFAVAAHLDPEILIVDEVLAVGDAQFQSKCLGRMGEISKGGRTVLFVSHNMGTISRLCPRSALLQDGRLVAQGPTHEVLGIYNSNLFKSTSNSAVTDLTETPQTTPCKFLHLEILDEENLPVSKLLHGQPFRIRVTVHSNRPWRDCVMGILFSDAENNPLFTTHSNDCSQQAHNLREGVSTFECHITPNPLQNGLFYLSLGLIDAAWNQLASIENAQSIEVLTQPHACSSLSARRPGKIAIPFHWFKTDSDT